VVHGVPNNYALKSGDILKLDFGVNYEGWNADAAWTIAIGNASEAANKLIKVTEKALFDGIKQMRAGRHLGDVGWAISRAVNKHGFRVVEGLTGHGIGREIHEDPSVFNEGKKGSGLLLKTGMVLAIEPMVSAGSPKIIQLKDESYATADGSLSAHFEHTVAITENGPEILTII
jgi:methionyl aminopeptidase